MHFSLLRGGKRLAKGWGARGRPSSKNDGFFVCGLLPAPALFRFQNQAAIIQVLLVCGWGLLLLYTGAPLARSHTRTQVSFAAVCSTANYDYKLTIVTAKKSSRSH
jgi:hypothetical protein